MKSFPYLSFCTYHDDIIIEGMIDHYREVEELEFYCAIGFTGSKYSRYETVKDDLATAGVDSMVFPIHGEYWIILIKTETDLNTMKLLLDQKLLSKIKFRGIQ